MPTAFDPKKPSALRCLLLGWSDSMSLAIAHRDGGRAILDAKPLGDAFQARSIERMGFRRRKSSPCGCEA